MCGIVGWVGAFDRRITEAMTDTLAHRGPDGRGTYFGQGVALGHRRLAIIDLEGGSQPMMSADGSLCVTFNGEIYNFVELRQQLARSGHQFVTSSDTEVLLAAYHQWGVDMVRHLNGMFAFGLWDVQRRRLVLARDHVGVKPLYWTQHGPSVAFASEPKALLMCPWVSRSVNVQALDAYMDLFYVPPPLSIFADLQQLAPGHTLVWEDGRIQIRGYWDALPTCDETLEFDEWVEVIEPVVCDAVAIQTRSDVPLGAFLSGGLDSSTIVALLAQAGVTSLDTFCVGYGSEGKSYDERDAARRVARHFGTNHHEVVLNIDVLGGIEEMVRGFDEPFGSPTALLSSAVSRFARGIVKVALAGDGGDELFGGYPRYRGMGLAEVAAGLPGMVHSIGERLAQGPDVAEARNYRRWARQFFASTKMDPAPRYASWVGYLSGPQRDQMYSDELRDTVRSQGRLAPVQTWFMGPPRGDGIERAAYADLHGFLPENVLRGSDRMSMVHGLELRVPLCDVRLAEIAMQVPSRHRLGALIGKRVLRKIAERLLPREVLHRRKQGFNAPLGKWLRRDLDAMVERWLHPDVIRRRGWFNHESIANLIAEHRAGARDHGLRLWSLIVLEQWQRCYVD